MPRTSHSSMLSLLLLSISACKSSTGNTRVTDSALAWLSTVFRCLVRTWAQLRPMRAPHRSCRLVARPATALRVPKLSRAIDITRRSHHKLLKLSWHPHPPCLILQILQMSLAGQIKTEHTVMRCRARISPPILRSGTLATCLSRRHR